MKDTVSVLIPTYKSVAFIHETLESVFNQTHTNIEVIVVDDASPDDTVSYIKKNFPKVKVIAEKTNKGRPAFGKNKAWQAATGDYVAFLDHDDMWLPEKLEKQLAVFHKNPRCELVTTNAYIYKEDTNETLGPVWKKNNTLLAEGALKRLIQKNFVVSSTSAMMKRDFIDRFGGFDEELTVADDYDLWLRAAQVGDMQIISEPLIKWRYTATSLSRSDLKTHIDQVKIYTKLLRQDLEPDLKELTTLNLATALTHLGNTSAAQGDIKEARTYWSHALDYRPDSRYTLMRTASYIVPALITQFYKRKLTTGDTMVMDISD